jgi:PHD/YefM family antitoxin component YafN of YafNO toxin-antitoxin module
MPHLLSRTTTRYRSSLQLKFLKVVAGNPEGLLQFQVMPSTYSVTEAQAALPAILKKAHGELIVVTRREKAVAYIVSAERMAGIAETLEIMADPKAMDAVRRARRGKGKYFPLAALDEN